MPLSYPRSMFAVHADFYLGSMLTKEKILFPGNTCDAR